MAGDLAPRPAFSMVEAVDFVDGFATQQRRLVTERWAESQRGVVGKKLGEGPREAQRLGKSGLGSEPRCCWQEPLLLVPTAKPRPPNVLGRKLSCCWQDAPGGAFGPAVAGAGGYAPPCGGESGGSVSNNHGAPHATGGRSPSTFDGRRDRRRSSGGDSRGGVVAGSRLGGKQIGWGGNGKVERVAGSSGRDDRSSGGSGSRWTPLIVRGPPARHPKTSRRRCRNCYRVFLPRSRRWGKPNCHLESPVEDFFPPPTME